MSDLIDRHAVVDLIGGANMIGDISNEAYKSLSIGIENLPSAQPACDSHEDDKVCVDKDAYEQCRFEYINACKITHNRTPDTRQSDINDAYAVIKALQPICGEESF